MRFTDEDEERIARMETMLVALAQGTVHEPANILDLVRGQRIVTSRAGMVGAAAALTAAAGGGMVLALHASGLGDRWRPAAGRGADTVQIVPGVTAPSPPVAALSPAVSAARPQHHRGRPSHRNAVTRAQPVGRAEASPPPGEQTLRDEIIEDARRTREVNEAQLDVLRRR